jgi:hypothetical protein
MHLGDRRLEVGQMPNARRKNSRPPLEPIFAQHPE